MSDRSTENLENKSPDDRRLDRLVDGSLDLPEQRVLLAQLEQHPEGWRRCALAFLEAQAWRSEFRQFDRSADCLTHRPIAWTDPSGVTNRHSARFHAIARPAGIALALCIAFGFGWLARPVALQRPQDVAGPAQQRSKSNLSDEAIVHKGPIVASANTQEPHTDDVHVAARLSWQLQEDGEQRRVDVPVLEGPGLDMHWLMQQPTAVQESIRKALERRGHKVETQRQLLTVNLKDGRSVVVPIDQVQVKFAKRVFQ